MDAMMQQILFKRSQNVQKTNVVFKTLSKPMFININYPCITSEPNNLFYTFDGRAVFYSKDQKSPIMALPDEIKDCQFIEANETTFCITLNSKGKLECIELSNAETGQNRYILNRNVTSMSKSLNKIFYLFKKEQSCYISECAFDGKKWLGRILIPNIPSTDVLLIASENTFYFITDSVLYNSKGKSLNIMAEYAYQYQNILFIVESTNSSNITVKLLDVFSGFKEVYQFVFKSDGDLFKVVSKENVVVLQCSSTFFIFKIDVMAKNFDFVWKHNFSGTFYDFDFTTNSNTLTFTLLTKDKLPDASYTISESNVSSCQEFDFNEESVTDCNTISNDIDNSMPTIDQEELSNECDIDSTDNKSNKDLSLSEFFYDPLINRSSPAIREKSVLSHAQKVTLPTPKNNLLEEVRATLNKKKPTNVSETTSEFIGHENDRFGTYIAQTNNSSSLANLKNNNNDESRTTDDQVLGKHKSGSHSSFFVPSNSSSDIKSNLRNMSPLFEAESAPNLNLFNFSSIKNPFDFKSPKSFIPETSSITTSHRSDHLDSIIQSIKELKVTIIDNQNKINNLSKNFVLIKKEDIESIIKETLVKAIVPTVEACFNEMRIQMQVELKKLLNDAVCNSNSSTTDMPIAKLLSEGQTSQAIFEFLKLDESQISSVVPLFLSSTLENADSVSLYQLLTRIYEMARKDPKDSYFKLVYLCLLDIEINDLPIEKLQDLSLILRYIKEIEGFDENKFSELGCVIDIVSKKIRKRAKMANGK